MHRLYLFIMSGCFAAASASMGVLANAFPFPQQPPSVTDTADAGTKTNLWYGTLKTESRDFRFVLEIMNDTQPPTGVLRSLDEGNQQFELSEIQLNAAKFNFKLPSTRAVYESQLDQSGKQTDGTWIQRGSRLPLTFQQVTAVPKRKIRNLFNGTLNAILQKLELSIIELDDGRFYFTSVTQNAGGFHVLKEMASDGEITFRIPALQATFVGRYDNKSSDVLKGKWTQGIISLPLELNRRDPKLEVQPKTTSKKPKRPQTPKPPFPYEIETVSIRVPDTNVTLAGTLTIPAGNVKAAVVLITGSGPQDRNEMIFDHQPFGVIADHFARNQIATFRYDDRGVGKSTGDFASATSHDLANDAEAAFRFLRNRDELRDKLVGICGHSEGGLLAPMIAARNSEVGFLILMAAPGVDGKAIILSQGPLLLRAQGVTESEITKQNKIQEIVLSFISAGEDQNDQLLAKQLRAALPNSQELPKILESVKQGLPQQATPWLREFLKIDPRSALQQVKCPVLALNGTKDLQVDPVLNLPVIRDTLRESGNHNVEINVYPGLNHLFQKCTTGLPIEYASIDETFNLVPLTRMTSWIHEQSASQP